MTKGRKFILQCLGIFVVLAVWEIVGQYLGELLLAPPSLVVVTYIKLLAEGEMLVQLAMSLRQMVMGFGLACLFGMPIGAMMGRVRVIDALVHPWISMLVVTSVAALLPVFILLFGTGFNLRVAIVFAASVGYVALTAYHGARGIDPRYLDVSRSFGVNRIEHYRKVILPALFPYLITGARLGLVHAIRAMIVAEMYIITGYGGLIFHTGLDISTTPILAYLATIMMVSIGANVTLRRVGQKLAPWYEARMGAA
jgi:ABC-type nitrate/sulfonate/bicarbonate transport system permease component